MKKIFLMSAICVGMSYQSIAQTKQVSGRVVDAKGNGIEGATVRVANDKTVIITQKDGSFKLTVPNNAKSIIVSYVGYNEVTAEIGSGSITVVIKESDKELSEVVITGYKSVSKREFGGAATVINAENVRSIPIASFDQMLQGQAAGVVVKATSGQPGASGSIQIRGRGTLIQGGTEPLYIVDGVRIASTDFALLNPNDIETFNILKDAASAGLYGSEGANGVIVITTKKGKAGKPRFELEGFMGWSTMPTFNDYRLMNTAEKIEYELRRNALLPPAFQSNMSFFSPAELDSLRKINTNWEDEITQTGKTVNISGSASGGTDKFKYYSSINYFKQEGTVRRTMFDRISARLNLSQDAGNFSFGLNLNGTYSGFSNTSEQNTSIATPLNGLQWANPYEQPFVRGRYLAIGNFTTAGTTATDITRPRVTATGQPIPTTDLYWNDNNSNQIRILAGANADYKIPFVKGLTARVVYGVDYRQFEDKRFIDRKTYSAGSNPRPTGGEFPNFRTNSYARNFTYRQRITNTWSLLYSKKVNDHSFDVTGNYETVDVSGSNLNNTTFSIITPFQNEAGATVNADLLPRITGGAFAQSLQSYFATASYGFANKYFISGNYRRDGSSAFGANKRNADFIGGSFSWIVSDEAFFSSLKNVFGNLKYKISYGTVGSSFVLGSYASQGTVVANRVYNSTAGNAVSVLANADLQWEVRKKFNTGIEFSALKNKLVGSIDYYNEKSEDLLSQKEISLTNGFASVNDNVASVRNAGIEFSFNYRVVGNRDFNLSINANFTYNKNQILSLADGKDTLVSLVGGIPMARIVGQPMNQLFLVDYVGVNPANGAAQYRKLDGSLTETFSTADRRAQRTTDPRYFGGFGFNAEYKGFALNTQFSYMLGMNIYNNERNNLENPDYFYDNVNADLLTQEWQKPGDVAKIPSPEDLFFSETTRFLENNSFLRL
ncbi:MAG: SusC/RagA family TonB-linked outer membrane protein, partial [Chitinophagaceae bacterium]|nr:SusC/RagA family TonB-linked outer membrane protein [Chitinophagaceae bacterium]